MTVKEFNEKYKDYLEEGNYGLDISIPPVIEYLDSIFENGLINIPGFKYSQIKLKFNMARFYFETNLDNKKMESIMEFHVENEINRLVKKYDSKNMNEALLQGHNPNVKDIV